MGFSSKQTGILQIDGRIVNNETENGTLRRKKEERLKERKTERKETSSPNSIIGETSASTGKEHLVAGNSKWIHEVDHLGQARSHG